MKTYTDNNGKSYNVDYTSTMPAGYGHQIIIARIINDKGNIGVFQGTTNHMRAFDNATDLEGQEKYEALFDIVEYDIIGKITEWNSNN